MDEQNGWLTEQQLIAETGEGPFTLDRLRRAGLLPWSRRFLGFAVGTAAIYPRIAVGIIRRIQDYRRRKIKGFDRWRLLLWHEGYPADVTKWHVARLHQLEKRADDAANGNIKNVVVDDAVAKGPLRRKPHQPIFNRVRQEQARKAVLAWSLAIGVGAAPPASIYRAGSPAAKAVRKAVGAGEALPDPAFELEHMSFARLRAICADASAGESEQGRLDSNRLGDIIALAASLDWPRIREAAEVTHQGGPAGPMAPYDRLIGLWDNLDFRVCLLPFLIFVRRQPGYRYELDERFASMEIELHALSDKATTNSRAA